jgi:hypothetical protein
MARHAAVDLALVFKTPPVPPDPDRLPTRRCEDLWQRLQAAGLDLAEGKAAAKHLNELRAMYEPFVYGLAKYLLYNLPSLLPEKLGAVDNWQTTAWARRAPGIGHLALPPDTDAHFD